MTIVIVGKELVQKSFVLEFRGSQHGEARKQCNKNVDIAICEITT
jgi:hypothetical protein